MDGREHIRSNEAVKRHSRCKFFAVRKNGKRVHLGGLAMLVATRRAKLKVAWATLKVSHRFDVMRLGEHIEGRDGSEMVTAGNQLLQVAGECRRVA